MNNHLPDEIDYAIINLLQKDGKLSHKEIAAKLNRSATPISLRIRRLEDEGYIKKYTVVVDQKKLGKNLTAFTQVQVRHHSKESLVAFMDEVKKLDEIIECCHMTGSFDFLLKISISDMDEYRKLLLNKLTSLPDVLNLQSSFVLAADTNFPIYRK